MASKMLKYSAGQVWLLAHDSSELDNSKREMAKYLVISSDFTNQRNFAATVLPISPKISNMVYSMQVEFTDEDQQWLINCDKIYTKRASEFELGTYICNIPKDIMDRVMERLTVQIGLDQFIPGYDTILSLIETVARQYREQLEARNTISSTQVEQICDKIESVFNERHGVIEYSIDLGKDNKNKRSYSVEAISKVIPVKHDSKNSSKSKKNSYKKSTYAKGASTKGWTDDQKIEFMLDCENMKQKDVAEKYNIPLGTVASRKARFAKLVTPEIKK